MVGYELGLPIKFPDKTDASLCDIHYDQDFDDG